MFSNSSAVTIAAAIFLLIAVVISLLTVHWTASRMKNGRKWLSRWNLWLPQFLLTLAVLNIQAAPITPMWVVERNVAYFFSLETHSVLFDLFGVGYLFFKCMSMVVYVLYLATLHYRHRPIRTAGGSGVQQWASYRGQSVRAYRVHVTKAAKARCVRMVRANRARRARIIEVRRARSVRRMLITGVSRALSARRIRSTKAHKTRYVRTTKTKEARPIQITKTKKARPIQITKTKKARPIQIIVKMEARASRAAVVAWKKKLLVLIIAGWVAISLWAYFSLDILITLKAVLLRL